MGSSSKETKATQTTDPYAPAQPYLQQALGLAGQAANDTYNGTGVAGMDPLVTQGQNQAISNANTGALGNIGTQAIGNVGNILGNGGLSQQQTDAASGIGSALTGFNSSMGTAQGALNPYVTGQYLNQPNPYLKQAVDTSMNDAAGAVNRQFSAAGRYGSGANTQVLADRLGNIANTAYMNDYNQQQQNQLNAINSLGSLSTSGLSGNLSGLGAIGNIGQQGFANTLAGAQAAPALSSAQNADANNLAQIGSQNMAYQQQLIDAANQNPWIKAGNLAQISGGIAGLGGTQSGTSTTTQQNDPISTIIGGATAGLGALKNLGGMSGLAGLFTLSDERAKEGISKVGRLDNGLNVYSYRYKGDDRPQIGVMAQEVEKTNPDAVIEHPSGYKMVNYGLASLKPKGSK